ncbi:MAG: hypothetical protein SGILL_009542, partial [Bacillariaceae sp.]
IIQEVPSDNMYMLKKQDDASKSWTSSQIQSVSGNDDAAMKFYYPSGGMSSLSQALMKEGAFNVQQDVWVSPSSGVKYRDGKWQVRAQGKVLGEYSHLVIAHNGKCADRLMSKTPAKDLHRLLRVNFNDRVPANGGQKMTLNSIYSVTVALKSPSVLSQALPDNFLAGFVQNHPKLSMISCQTNKYPPSTYNDGNSEPSQDNNVEVWNILSTASFAKKNKAPQEFLPEDVVANVTQWLVEALDETFCDKSKDTSLMDQLLEARVQLWGAAVPMNVWKANGNSAGVGQDAGFIYDSQYQVGVCGDWLLEPSIAGAWTSGRRMAKHLKEARISTKGDSVGLDGQFIASPSVRNLAIASFDGPMNERGGPVDDSSRHPRGQPGRKANNNGRRRNNRKSRQKKQESPKRQTVS